MKNEWTNQTTAENNGVTCAKLGNFPIGGAEKSAEKNPWTTRTNYNNNNTQQQQPSIDDLSVAWIFCWFFFWLTVGT